MSKITPRNNPCYCINFRRAANTLTKFYDHAFAPINLTANQFSLLNDIHLLKSCNKSELAKYARLDRTTIIRNLNVLCQKNFIKEVQGVNNRNRVIQLTEAGEAVIKEGFVIWEQLQNKVKQIMGEENASVQKQVFANVGLLESL